MRASLFAVTAVAVVALTLAACSGDDEPDETAPEETPAADADAPAMDADAPAMDATPTFGTEADFAFAGELWAALDAANLVGENVIHAPFYPGDEPHGFVLEALFADITIDGMTATAIVKRNYGPEGVAVDEVADNPNDHLAAITVMYQRSGFNADTNDWFWVKWLPDGTLDLAGETQMAGNVGGCIGCHGDAPGDDWIFVSDRAIP